MTLREWQEARLADVPAPLAARLRELLAGDAGADASELPERAVRAAEAVVARLLREECTTREGALDLLAADALVTTAFEAASEDPERLAGRAREAMGRLAGLADAGGRP